MKSISISVLDVNNVNGLDMVARSCLCGCTKLRKVNYPIFTERNRLTSAESPTFQFSFFVQGRKENNFKNSKGNEVE